MPLIATEGLRYSNLVKQELWPEHGYCREVITVNEATAKSYVVGTVLGKVTATGKFKIALQAAADGSQTPAAVSTAEYAIPAATDTKILALTRGPALVSKYGLQLDASFGTQAQKDAAYAALEAKDMLTVDSL